MNTSLLDNRRNIRDAFVERDHPDPAAQLGQAIRGRSGANRPRASTIGRHSRQFALVHATNRRRRAEHIRQQLGGNGGGDH